MNLLRGCFICLRQARFYHDTRSLKKLPTVRVASSAVSRRLRFKEDLEAQPKVQSSKTFVPFPFVLSDENKAEAIRKIVNPIGDVPYSEQLELKESLSKTFLRNLANQLYRENTPIRIDVAKLPCKVDPIIPSSKTSSFKNSVDLSIWYGVDGKTNTVGYLAFPLGLHGNSVAVEVNSVPTLKEVLFKISDVLQDFVRFQAKLPVSYDLGAHGGWRLFKLESNEAGDIMLIGQINPRGLKISEIMDEKMNFKNFMTSRSSELQTNLVSIYIQLCPHSSCPPEVAPYELIYGEKTIKERLGSYEFEFGPASYLQDNISGLSSSKCALSEIVSDLYANNQPLKPLVIDLTCGVGANAAFLSDKYSHYVGIGDNPELVDEAKKNIKTNALTNAEVVCADAVIVLPRILEKFSEFDGEAIVLACPKRRGLNEFIIQVIRNSKKVSKVIYEATRIGSNDKGYIQNLVSLCRRGKAKSSTPFLPVRAIPIDMYPHVPNCDLLIALERTIE